MRARGNQDQEQFTRNSAKRERASAPPALFPGAGGRHSASRGRRQALRASYCYLFPSGLAEDLGSMVSLWRTCLSKIFARRLGALHFLLLSGQPGAAARARNTSCCYRGGENRRRGRTRESWNMYSMRSPSHASCCYLAIALSVQRIQEVARGRLIASPEAGQNERGSPEVASPDRGCGRAR